MQITDFFYTESGAAEALGINRITIWRWIKQGRFNIQRIGAVVFIHELGHFIVAKLGGIKVEAFSIGFPPTILAVRKLKKGFRMRLFPKIGQEPELAEGDSETDYWLGIIPFGGFVKMLGSYPMATTPHPVEQHLSPEEYSLENGVEL